MKKIPPFVAVILFFVTSLGIAQDNLFLERGYWAGNPSIEKIEKDIAAGNDIAELNDNMFDPVCYALLEDVDNATLKHLMGKKGNEVDKLTHDGRTYIFWAAYRDNLEIMKYLVKNGAKANIKDSHGYNVINFAARGGQTDTELYDFLLAQDADINDTTHNGATALLLVAPSVSNYKTMNYFTGNGLDLKGTDNDGNGLFHYAARGGNITLLKTLIEKGLPFDQKNKKGGNAILMASEGIDNQKNGLKILKYLEGLGIEPSIVDSEGHNPLHAVAYKSDNLEIFQYFIDKGVDINQKGSGGETPFMNAASSNELKVVQFLSDYVKDINAQDTEGRSALTMAVHRNEPEVVAFLIQKGGDVMIKDSKGNTLGYYLLNNFDPKNPKNFGAKLKLLRENGLTLNEPQQSGNSLLHLAAKVNNLALLKRLEDLNIDIDQKNDEGNTALHLAAMTSENDAILKYLIAQGADKRAKTDFEESVYDLASENELLRKNQVGLEFLE